MIRRMNTLSAALIYIFFALNSSASFAGELHGVKMPDSLNWENKKLILNGMGAREATIFKVKVYIAGLYLEASSKDAEAILASPQNKVLRMHFVHEVGASKLRDAFGEGIHKNCRSGCDTLEEPLKKFNALLQDMKKDDELVLNFQPQQVGISIKGVEQKPLGDAAFSKALLSVWLGSEPPNAELKTGILSGGHP